MGRGWVIVAALAAGLLIGNPYFSWVLFRVMGAQTASSANRDGTTSTMVWGPNVAVPEWVPVMPDTLLIKRARRTEVESRPSTSGGMELLSHADAPTIVAWYREALADRGFTIEPARTPDVLDRSMSSSEGEVRATSAAQGVDVRVLVRLRQGILLRPRLLEVDWFDHRDRKR